MRTKLKIKNYDYNSDSSGKSDRKGGFNLYNNKINLNDQEDLSDFSSDDEKKSHKRSSFFEGCCRHLMKKIRCSREYKSVPNFNLIELKPTFELPSSSSDLCIHSSLLLKVLEIHQFFLEFSAILKVTPFTLDFFCQQLTISSSSHFSFEIFSSLIKAILREDEKQNMMFSSKEAKDSVAISFFLIDEITYLEIIHMYLKSIWNQLPASTRLELSDIYKKTSYWEFEPKNKVFLLDLLMNIFLSSSASREVLNGVDCIRHEEQCRSCHKRGNLLCCESCPAMYHLQCIDPPLHSIPNGDWFCIACSKHKKQIKNWVETMHCSRGQSRDLLLGFDRFARRYWFVACRIFIETYQGELVAYLSTEDKLEDLLTCLDELKWEKELVSEIKRLKCIMSRDFKILNQFIVPSATTYHYDNIYSTEVLALTKQQQVEEREKKRFLAYKFSLTSTSEFHWVGEFDSPSSPPSFQSLNDLLVIFRNTITHLHDSLPKSFLHKNWPIHSTRWLKAVQLCKSPRDFSLAILIFEACIKPFLFTDVWHQSAGHFELHQTSLEERELEKLKEQEEKVQRKEILNKPLPQSFVKFPLGLRHQVWKQKGEEYRLTGKGGWVWISNTRKLQNSSPQATNFQKSFIYKSSLKYSGVFTEKENLQKEICESLSEWLTKRPQLESSTPRTSFLNKLLFYSLRLKQNIQSTKQKVLQFLVNEKEESVEKQESFSNTTTFMESMNNFLALTDKLSTEDSNLSLESIKTKINNLKSIVKSQINYYEKIGSCRLKVSLKKECPSLKLKRNLTGALPQPSTFQSRLSKKYSSVFCLDGKNLITLARKGGLIEEPGYLYFPGSSFPRPNFKTAWRFRLKTVSSFFSLALQIRTMWVCIRWDDMAFPYPPQGILVIDGTEAGTDEVTTCELVKRRILSSKLDTVNYKVKYLVTKTIIFKDSPNKSSCSERSIQRTGLRERKVVGPLKVSEWVGEEELELWQIKYFNEMWEKQMNNKEKCSDKKSKTKIDKKVKTTSKPKNFLAEVTSSKITSIENELIEKKCLMQQNRLAGKQQMVCSFSESNKQTNQLNSDISLSNTTLKNIIANNLTDEVEKDKGDEIDGYISQKSLSHQLVQTSVNSNILKEQNGVSGALQEVRSGVGVDPGGLEIQSLQSNKIPSFSHSSQSSHYLNLSNNNISNYKKPIPLSELMKQLNVVKGLDGRVKVLGLKEGQYVEYLDDGKIKIVFNNPIFIQEDYYHQNSSNYYSKNYSFNYGNHIKSVSSLKIDGGIPFFKPNQHSDHQELPQLSPHFPDLFDLQEVDNLEKNTRKIKLIKNKRKLYEDENDLNIYDYHEDCEESHSPIEGDTSHDNGEFKRFKPDNQNQKDKVQNKKLSIDDMTSDSIPYIIPITSPSQTDYSALIGQGIPENFVGNNNILITLENSQPIDINNEVVSTRGSNFKTPTNELTLNQKATMALVGLKQVFQKIDKNKTETSVVSSTIPFSSPRSCTQSNFQTNNELNNQDNLFSENVKKINKVSIGAKETKNNLNETFEDYRKSQPLFFLNSSESASFPLNESSNTTPQINKSISFEKILLPSDITIKKNSRGDQSSDQISNEAPISYIKENLKENLTKETGKITSNDEIYFFKQDILPEKKETKEDNYKFQEEVFIAKENNCSKIEDKEDSSAKEAEQAEESDLHCICRTPYDSSRFYIGCDVCWNWFHGECVGISVSESSNLNSFICPFCCLNSNKEENLEQPKSEEDEEGLKRPQKEKLHSIIFELKSLPISKLFLDESQSKNKRGFKYIEQRLWSGELTCIEDFIEDFETFFQDLKKNHHKQSNMYKDVCNLQTHFQKLVSNIVNNP